MFWSIGVPLLNAVVLSTVFSWLLRGRLGDQYHNVPFMAFYFAGIAPWTLFLEATSRSTGVIIDNASIVKRIPFPLETLCMQVVLSACISYGVMLVSAIIVTFAYGTGPSPRLLYLLGLLPMTACLTLGACYVLSALTVYFRDLAQIVPIVLNLVFFMTPILYPPNLLEHAPYWAKLIILDLNPLHHLVEAHRFCIFGGPDINVSGLIYASIVSALVGLGGLLTFRRLKVGFADVL
jgi:ABC-type polysaccharide/polyol phosphate export permease